MRKLNRKTFDALSISKYVIKNGCSHGARHRKSEEQVYYHRSFNAWKRCQKKTDNQDSTLLSFLTDLSKIQDTVRRRRSTGGQKISV